MKGYNNCFGYLIQQNIIELSKRNMMLPYGGFITRLLYAFDIAISPDEEVIKLDRFSIINRNLLWRLRCIFRNSIWTRLLRRIDPHQPEPEPEIPIFRGNQSPPIGPFEESPLVEQAPPSSIEDIGTQMDRFEQRQDRLE